MSPPTDQVPALALRGGETIPQLGFGVFQIPPQVTEAAVILAFEAGYRHIDTAAAYRNEGAVGQAVRAGGPDRGEVFITTKCWNDDQGASRGPAGIREEPAAARARATSTST